jgi:hypothetical protein
MDNVVIIINNINKISYSGCFLSAGINSGMAANCSFLLESFDDDQVEKTIGNKLNVTKDYYSRFMKGPSI